MIIGGCFMAKLHMQGKGDLREVAQKINDNLSGKILSLTKEGEFYSDNTYFVVYEKYFMRSENRASLSIVLIDRGGMIEIQAIGAAAGTGAIFKFSWGSESDFVYSLQSVLIGLGFAAI